ncbi:MAG TPA: cytochrome c-type biogenesis protein CcmH [Gammaproteobacteria bacterium]|nr:cytochrome c-type biogenesis protein CcmH [Gammaproteobacteria bacterium]HQZ87266.1 cytochrome c-type biogenesis protein CcmH [Gammaproteobacteria bacterium]HRA42133.1 cytochrome c-type biogenesis protein CcmH [Gammaproteobacteria bacterium]
MHENRLHPNDKGEDIYPFSDPSQHELFTKVIHELRCSVCQNQNLSDSMAPLAVDLRNEIYQKVRTHHSESEILEFVTHRYGAFVLYNPPLHWNTAFLWFGPVLILVMGFFLFSKYVKRGSGETP